MLFINSFLRLSRAPQLAIVRRLSALPDGDQSTRTRIIGIIAHIDAGKTTTTERMLFYSGLSHCLGEVHKGDTITDYMPQERERGITITSAAVTLPWKKHRINVLDTPGHVDFTIEVERCLSVIDGSVVILDASAGVEAQTMTVWRQADKFFVPKLVYLNKMDKSTANLTLCRQSLEKLGAKPLQIHLPIYEGKTFIGLADIVDMQKYVWSPHSDSGKHFDIISLDPKRDENIFDLCCKNREDLISFLSDIDERLSDHVIHCDKLIDVPSNVILNALRFATIKNLAHPVLCGSSYKNIGVQVLMDAILKYLPSPFERKNEIIRFYGDKLCLLVFKIIHHKILGQLTFARIYSGNLAPSSKVYNVNRGTYEKIHKIYIPFADEFKEVSFLNAGNIVVLSGLKFSFTGDTLTSSIDAMNEAKQRFYENTSSMVDEYKPVLVGIEAPIPVFFCSIEAPSPSKQKDLEKALENLEREDPSLTVTTSSESGQTIISGMGELQIEILKDRLLKEYKIEAFLGPLQISYRESIDESVEETTIVNKIVGGIRNDIEVTLRLKPKINAGIPKKIKVIGNQENDLRKLKFDRIKAIENGMALALNNGPILGFGVVDLEVELLDLKITSKTTNSMLSAAISQCIGNALKKSSPFLLEPVMKLEISFPEKYTKVILSTLSPRRSIIEEIEKKDGYNVIHALTPLSELRNYATEIRTVTSGMANLSMKLWCYQKMNEAEQRKAIESVFGFV